MCSSGQFDQATHCGAGGVSAMSTVGDYHFHAVIIAIGKMIAAHHHQAGELAMGAGIGVECEFFQSRELSERLLQVVIHSQSALHVFLILQWVQAGELRLSAHLLVNLGVIFHCARAQWVKTGVHTKVVVAHVGVVAHNSHLINLGQAGSLLALQLGWQVGEFILSDFVLGQAIALATLF